jgi:hypothetical protein
MYPQLFLVESVGSIATLERGLTFRSDTDGDLARFLECEKVSWKDIGADPAMKDFRILSN